VKDIRRLPPPEQNLMKQRERDFGTHQHESSFLSDAADPLLYIVSRAAWSALWVAGALFSASSPSCCILFVLKNQSMRHQSRGDKNSFV
jgi:hypothetical protein